ncbi:GNAT family N-acetyltransferase [Shimia marina]|uniref:GNAT family N-acetyltransferase n=1 Tax=Shimia marina TaxID=321267 RepID=UPI0008E9AD0D|nr:GNAT family N-acetyltransferase [Shimia marina]SFE31102.1 Ribosomal protein S18 acetylase RimI [Shimia marina]
MIVRALARKDIPKVVKLARKLAEHVNGPDPKLTTEIVEELACGETRRFEALVVEHNREIVGFAAFTQSFELHTNSRALLVSDLFVSDQIRKSGVGQVLLEALHRVANDRKCGVIRFEVWQENEQARAFYAKHDAQAVDDVDLWQIAI